MNLFSQITRIGIQADLADDIKAKLVLTNKINLIALIANTLLFLFTWNNAVVHSLTLIASVAYGLSLLLNSLHFHNVARILTAISGILAVSYIHALTLPAGAPPSSGIIAFSLAQVPLASILFHFTERRKIILTLGIDLLLIGSYRFLSKVLYDDRYSFFLNGDADGPFYSVIASFLMAVGIVFLQTRAMRQAYTHSQQALADLQKHRQDMEDTQQQLQQSLEEVQQTRKEDEKRNWTANGLAHFTELLRSHHHLPDIYDTLLSNLVKYVSANQAVLFVVTEEEEQEPFLNLAACYAYERKKYLERRISMGQGLVGQTYLEGKTVQLHKVPSGYVQITSGLGYATPRFLLVVPLRVNDRIEGILEVASFQVLEDYQVAFLEKVGEGIASEIANHRIAATTQALLEQSREQAHELHSNEEAMRLNLEELKATQEEWQRIEKFYDQRIQELEKENVTLKKYLQI